MMGQLVARGHELDAPSRSGRRPRGQHLQLHRSRQEGIRRYHPRDGRVQEDRPRAKADRRRLPGGTLPRRYPQGTCPKSTPSSAPTNWRASSPLCEGMEPPTRNPLEPYLYHDLTPRVLATPAPFRLHQDRRRLRPSLHVLRDPAVSRRIPQPPLRVGDLRSHAPVPAGRARDQPDRPGHHLLRRGPRAQGRPAAAAGAAGADRNRRTKSGSASSTPIPNKVTQKLLDTIAEHAALVKYIDMPLQHASAARAEAHEARRLGRHLPEAARAHPPHHSRRRHPHQLHRRLPRRDRRGFRRAVPVRGSRASSTTWASSPIPTRTPAAAIALDGKVDGRTIQNRKRRLMAIQRKISRARNRALVGQRSSGAGRGPLQGDRPALGSAHVHAGAGDRRRHADQRFRRRRSRAPGEIRRLRITEAHDYDVVGTLLAPTEPAPQPALRARSIFQHSFGMTMPDLQKRSRKTATPSFPFAASAAGSSIWATGPSEKYVIPGPASDPQPKTMPKTTQPHR